MSPFKFNLADRLLITCSGETGEVIARGEYLTSEPSYLLRYRANDGRAVEAWWPQSAVAPATATAEAATTATGTDPHTPPRIGSLWAAQGGLYAGVARGLPGQPDHHLILAAPSPAKRLAWQAAMDWAATLQVRGHSDWVLPTRAEAALLYANLKAECVPEWHWTSETHEDDGSYAWSQYFLSGYQGSGHKSYEGRARAVRRFPLQSFSA